MRCSEIASLSIFLRLTQDMVDANGGSARGELGMAAIPTSMLSLLRLEDAGLDPPRRAVDFGAADGGVLAPLVDVRLRSPLPRPNSLRDCLSDFEHPAGGERGRRAVKVVRQEEVAHFRL